MMTKKEIKEKALKAELPFDIFANQVRNAGLFLDITDEAYYNRDLDIEIEKNKFYKKGTRKDENEF